MGFENFDCQITTNSDAGKGTGDVLFKDCITEKCASLPSQNKVEPKELDFNVPIEWRNPIGKTFPIHEEPADPLAPKPIGKNFPLYEEPKDLFDPKPSGRNQREELKNPFDPKPSGRDQREEPKLPFELKPSRRDERSDALFPLNPDGSNDIGSGESSEQHWTFETEDSPKKKDANNKTELEAFIKQYKSMLDDKNTADGNQSNQSNLESLVRHFESMLNLTKTPD